jgi:hypothetical protein
MYVVVYWVVVTYYQSFWTLFLAPAIGTLVIPAWLAVRPVNPYRHMYARIEGKDENLDSTNPAARELVSILASTDSWFFVLKIAILNCLGLVLIMLAITLIRMQTLDWIFRIEDVAVGSFLFAMPSTGLLGNLLLRRTFLNWRPLPQSLLSMPPGETRRLEDVSTRQSGRFMVALICRFSSYLAIAQAIFAAARYMGGGFVLLDRVLVTFLIGLLCFAISWKLGFQGLGLDWKPPRAG